MKTVQAFMSADRWRKMPIWLVIVLIVALVAVLIGGGITAGMFFGNEYVVDLSLNGPETVTVEYGQTYEEPGVQAKGYGTILHKDPEELAVQITGSVDVSKLGTYEITYYAVFEGAEASVTRTVQVVDTTAPVISLTPDDPEKYTLPNEHYEEAGYTASDNYDGDLTDKVTVLEQDGKVFYTVTDSSGNETTVERTICYADPIAPVLTLKGDSKITVTEDSKWEDPGFTASDNVDGDLTAQVTVTGTVDLKKPGTYKLTYEVQDGYGNVTKAERTVTVKAKPQTQPPSQSGSQGGTNQGGTGQGSVSANGQGRVIYLTFDDGPSKHTSRLLSVLAQYNVKATFFVCGSGSVSMLDDIANGGHTLALHSKTHKYNQIYASESAYYDDLYAIRDIVEKYSGVKSSIIRFPGGSSNVISKKYCPGIMTTLTRSVQEKGFVYFDWNIDSNDAGGAKTSNEVANNVINGISRSKRKNLVVLQHDTYGYSVDAVEQIIQWGLSCGFTFKALTPDSPTCHHNVSN